MAVLTSIGQALRSERRTPEVLTIQVSAGAGAGGTSLSAFDAALNSAGVADFNLIRLSSVIPGGADVVEVSGRQQLPGAHGDRLYCVYAAAYASAPMEQAWAGVAWSRRDDGSGEGLFVEHTGPSLAVVEHDLRLSLADLAAGRPGRFVETGLLTASTRYVDRPACAVVIATYQTSSWSRRDH